MATPPLPNETVELVEHEVAFQGYFRVGRYFFRHGLYQGGQSATLRREVFERGHAAAVLPYDPLRDEVVLIRQFRAGAYVAGRHPWTWEVVAHRARRIARTAHPARSRRGGRARDQGGHRHVRHGREPRRLLRDVRVLSGKSRHDARRRRLRA